MIAVASIAVTLTAGIVMRFTEDQTYPSIGSGLWWAVQTTTTVGYGDNVPVTAAGRFIAVLVMLFGIGFLTVITAAITSTFVSRSRLEQRSTHTETPVERQLHDVEQRLDRIERALTGTSRPERTPSDAETATAQQLHQIDTRLERIEAALTRSS